MHAENLDIPALAVDEVNVEVLHMAEFIFYISSIAGEKMQLPAVEWQCWSLSEYSYLQ